MRTKDRAAGNLPDEPTACIGHQDRERHDGGLEFSASRARERRRHADPLDRLNLVGIRSPFRGLTFLREEKMEGPLQIGGQVVPLLLVAHRVLLKPGEAGAERLPSRTAGLVLYPTE